MGSQLQSERALPTSTPLRFLGIARVEEYELVGYVECMRCRGCRIWGGEVVKGGTGGEWLTVKLSPSTAPQPPSMPRCGAARPLVMRGGWEMDELTISL